LSVPVDKELLLKGFLGQLPSDVVSRLAKAVEVDRLIGGKALPHDEILRALRPQLRGLAASQGRRIPTPQRLFCRPFEDLFVDLRDGKPLPMRGYVFLGSRFVEIEEGGAKKRIFLADYEGNLIAVHPDVARDAAANRAVSDCLFDAYTLDDEPYAWADVDEGKLPTERIPVEFVFALDARADCRPFEPEVIPPPIELPPARVLAQKTRNPAWDGTRAEWLDRIGARPLQELAAIVRHSRQPLREAVLVLLGASGRDEAVETLSLALRFDRSSESRLAAAYALAEVGSAKAVDALIDALEVPAPPIVDDAVCGLRLLSGEDLGRRPLPWREWARTRSAPR